MIAGRRQKHLRLVLEAAKRLAVDDAVAVALECRAHVVFRLRAEASARLRTPGRLRRENGELACLELFADIHRGSGPKASPSLARRRGSTGAGRTSARAVTRRYP